MIITVSREFGSGGRELARRLAGELGYSYFDNELIQKTAQESGLDKSFVKHVTETGGSAFYNLTIASRMYGRMSSSLLQNAEVAGNLGRILHSIAKEDNCVIVGRAADAILADSRPLRIFVWADREARTARCITHARPGENTDSREIWKRIRDIDRGREDFYALFSHRRWGDRENYDLCINTGGRAIKTLVGPLAAYARAWGGLSS